MSFEARYYGRCAACGERIEPGDEVVYDMSEVIHVECEDDDDFEGWGQ